MIIVCGGIKGGTGKTTIASNLTSLRARSHDVLLLQTDTFYLKAVANQWVSG
jgi:cellulose biosynthesis protein BcsQ